MTGQDALMRSVGRMGSAQRRVLDTQDIGLEATAKELKHQLRLNPPPGAGSSI